jgi:hypothetical protein
MKTGWAAARRAIALFLALLPTLKQASLEAGAVI